MTAHPIPDSVLIDHLAVLQQKHGRRLIVVDGKLNVEFAFLERMFTRLSTNEKGCWLFNGYTKNGYSSMSSHDAQVYLHRVSWAAANRPIKDGMNTCHHCDIKRCIRPDHLFEGTQLDNVKDMTRKGRAKKPGPKRRGEKHYKATLSDQQVAQLRMLQGRRTQREVAAIYGVSQSTVW